MNVNETMEKLRKAFGRELTEKEKATAVLLAKLIDSVEEKEPQEE